MLTDGLKLHFLTSPCHHPIITQLRLDYTRYISNGPFGFLDILTAQMRERRRRQGRFVRLGNIRFGHEMYFFFLLFFLFFLI